MGLSLSWLSRMSMGVVLLTVLGGCSVVSSSIPIRIVNESDTVIDRSCRIVIPKGVCLSDDEGDGALRVVGDGITVEFAEGTVLRNAKGEPESYDGIGILVVGQDVVLRHLRIEGFRCGVLAQDCGGLIVEDCQLRDLRRQRLRSTALAEESADWLRPHENDGNEWLTRYGAAIYLQRCRGAVVRRCRVRDSQNALLLDRVEKTEVYDNDFSFLSGWGVGLWRSSDNVICKNALDFCIRGYSHGIYNRGQDSAALLMFEQCHRNVVAFNSMTHGGDGVFGFAGREALGEIASPHPLERRGNNDNRFEGNDLSYAAAHGWEMTFSFGNILARNRIVGNAICGVWGGYSCDTLISENLFEQNGGAGYGLERGGINIEHGARNQILGNRFRDNECSIHLWWDDDAILQGRWAVANGGGESRDNVIASNRFVREALVLHQRGRSECSFFGNTLIDVAEVQRLESAEESNSVRQLTSDLGELPLPLSAEEMPGTCSPVGARASLRGREHIVMTEWGPWDHQRLLLRELPGTDGEARWEVRIPDAEVPVSEVPTLEVSGEVVAERIEEGLARDVWRISATGAGVHPYRLVVRFAPHVAVGPTRIERREQLLVANWDAVFFAWDAESDPRENLAQWRQRSAAVKPIRLSGMRLGYGMRGPSETLPQLADEALGSNFFGMCATCALPLPAGRWRFRVLSDDGVRLTADDRVLIDNWTWHAPTWNSAVLELEHSQEVALLLEHFEIDGHAVLELWIDREFPVP